MCTYTHRCVCLLNFSSFFYLSVYSDVTISHDGLAFVTLEYIVIFNWASFPSLLAFWNLKWRLAAILVTLFNLWSQLWLKRYFPTLLCIFHKCTWACVCTHTYPHAHPLQQNHCRKIAKYRVDVQHSHSIPYNRLLILGNSEDAWCSACLYQFPTKFSFELEVQLERKGNPTSDLLLTDMHLKMIHFPNPQKWSPNAGVSVL